MKKCLFIIALSACGALSAMEQDADVTTVTLPESCVIEKRLSAQNMSALAISITGFHTHFGGKTMRPEEIPTEINAIREKILQGTPDEKKAFLDNHMKTHTPKVIAAVLADHPKEIKKLQDQGLLQ